MEQTVASASDVALPLICRPNRVYWLGILFFGAIGLFTVSFPFIGITDTTPKNSRETALEWLYLSFIGGCFLLPSILLAVWVLRARIVADRQGLRWRGLIGPWQNAAWDDVTDYYERLHLQSYALRVPPSTIETKAGKVGFDKDWLNTAALREMVQTQAAHARVRQWGIFGTRPEDDWPRVFSYRSQWIRWETGIVGTLNLSLTIICFWIFVPEIFQRYAQGGGLWDVLLYSWFPFLMVALAVLNIFMLIEREKTFVRYRNQRIIVDPIGITYEEGEDKVSLTWKEVTGYYVTIERRMTGLASYVIETPKGDINFLPLLKDALLLKSITRRYVTVVGNKEWRAKEDLSVLGGIAAKWSGGRAGIGRRIYHYRTRMNRLALLGLLCFGGVPTLVFVLEKAFGLPPTEDPIFVAAYSDILLLIFFWVLWRYRAAQFHTDEDGIWQYAIFGKRFLTWQNIQNYHKSGGDILTFGNAVGPEGRRLQFWMGIADAEELMAEIARRAVNAQTNSW